MAGASVSLVHEESVEHLPKGAIAAEPVARNLVLLPLGAPASMATDVVTVRISIALEPGMPLHKREDILDQLVLLC